jgi:MerR family mercuric resistance operon transcriptional regulator
MSCIQETLTIGPLAKAAGVHVETIRFYQRKGLLSEPDKPPGAIRRYGEAPIRRVRFIKSAQGLGFKLNEIGELLSLDDGSHCQQASALAERKLIAVRETLAALMQMEAALSELVDACQATRGSVSCPLITRLNAGERS